MEFQNIDEIKELFLRGGFDFPDEMMVAGVKYKVSKSPMVASMRDIIKKGKKAMWVYFTSLRELSQDRGLDHAIVFLWAFKPGTDAIVPASVEVSSKARLPTAGMPTPEAGMEDPIAENTNNGDSVNIPKEKIIGDIVDVIITSMPGSKTIKGKVDTGADVSSLHAEDYQISNGQVTFTTPELSENQITVPVIEKQAIKLSNADMEYRPVIELNIKINDQQLSNVMFNLNDRGAMTYPMLVGQNVLECGGFMIDPRIDMVEDVEDYEVDWEALQEEFKDIEAASIVEEGEGEGEVLQKLVDFVEDLKK